MRSDGSIQRRARGRTGRILLPLILLVGIVLVACARATVETPAEQPALLDEASAALDRSDFAKAEELLRSVATRCESGADGPAALLLLAAMHLDPRNPHGSPVVAAQLAARYLQVPSAPPASVGEAESLYLLSLDLGAPPVEDPLAPIPSSGRDRPARRVPSGWRAADRFDGCERSEPAVAGRPLPRHPGTPLWEALERVWAERDSLSRRVERLSEEADEEGRSLRARIDSLESELRRIRELLREGVETPVDPS